MPILNINLRSENATVLKEVSEELEKQLEELPEISEVDIRGLPLQEMRIEVDPIKAQSVKVTLDDIQNAVSAENQTIPGGEILMDGIRKTVRIEGEYKSAEELKRTVVKQDEFYRSTSKMLPKCILEMPIQHRSRENSALLWLC